MSLKFKFSLLTFSLVFATLLVSSVVLAYRSIALLKTNLIERDLLISDKMTPLLLTDFGNYYAYQYDAYLASVKQQLSSYPDLTYFRIVNTDSELMFESNETQGREPTRIHDEHITQAIASKTRYQDVMTQDGEQLVRIIVPYVDNFDAFRNIVEFRFSLSAVEEAIKETILFFVVLLTVLTGVGIVSAGYFVSRLTKPLQRLTAASARMSEGDLGETVVVTTHDEVGALSKAFNTMSLKLQVLYQGLRDKVQEIGQEKAKHDSAIASLPRAIVLIDTHKTIVSDNGRLGDIFGLPKTPWTTQMIDLALGADLGLLAKVETVLATRQTVSLDAWQLGAKFLQIFIAPVVTGSQELIGAVLTINDVTEEKVLERSKDEFFSIASHELRTPLTAIRGNTSMILDYYGEALKDPELKAMVVDTHEASKRLIGIVNDFLDLSRLEQGKMQFSLSEFKIAEVVTKVIKELEANASKKQVTLKLVGDVTLVVKADIGKVEQVLFNLLGNSLKFTQGGSVTVTIGRDKGRAVLVIADTGLGISPANQGLLFHKFQQAGSSLLTRDGAKGTGLGLYISRLMAEGMGGKLWLVKSSEGKGSTFAWSLPLPVVAKS